MKEYSCKYCGAKLQNGFICSQCHYKLKLVRQLRHICDQIVQVAKPKPKLIELDRLNEALTKAYQTNLNDGRTEFACGILLAKSIVNNQPKRSDTK